MNTVRFIGIAGGSCSGKTTLAAAVAERLGIERAALVAIDSYYKGLPSASPGEIEIYNFDDPAALDYDLLVTHLRELAAGHRIEKPVYDFETHTRTESIIRVDPSPYVVVEGLFPLYWDRVRAFLGTKVFIDIPHSACLARRLARDTRERGRPREEVIRRYNDMARPNFEKYVLPSRSFANVIVDGERPMSESADAVLRHIESV